MARPEEPPARLDEVPEVDQRQQAELLADDVAAQVQLDAAGAVAQVDEGRAAHVADRRHAAGDGHGAAALLEALAFVALEERDGLRRLVGSGRAGGVGVAEREQLLALLPAQLDQFLFGRHRPPARAAAAAVPLPPQRRLRAPVRTPRRW